MGRTNWRRNSRYRRGWAMGNGPLDSSEVIAGWTVDYNDDGDAVRLEFSHVGPDGVEAFVTAMPRFNAIELGEALIEYARELPE